MSITATLAALLADARRAAAADAAALARSEARYAWALRTIAAMFAAQQRVTDAWNRRFDTLPDDLDDAALAALPDPPEQAELDRLLALIDAMRHHDRWPRHLYWSNI